MSGFVRFVRSLATIAPFALVAASLAGCPEKGTNSVSDASAALTGSPGVGRAAVETRACGTCHKAADGTLSGQTTPQPNTMAYPANLTPDSETGIGEWSAEQIVKAVLTGIDDEDEQLCTTMPKFKDLGMTESEANDIAAYLKSLAPVKHEIPESSCPPIKSAK